MASTQPTATAAWRRWRFRGVVLLLVLPVVAAYALVMTGNARADGSGPSPDPSADALGAAGGQAVSDAQASTDQAANAAAEAAQEARNVVISIRVDSPGDDGAISQANTATADAGATNDASTAQGQGGGAGNGSGDVASSLEAATQQAANAVAAAAQQGQNIVVSIRINSPGNNGSIGQTNSSTANANAGNTAATNQGAGAASPQADPASSPSAATSVASGPKSVLPRLVTERPSAPPAPASRRAAHGEAGSAAPRHDEQPVTSGNTAPNESSSASASRGFASAPSAAAPARTRTVWSPATTEQRVPSHPASAAVRAPKQSGGPGRIRQAASWLSNLRHPASLQGEKAQSISDPVILALLAVAVAGALSLLAVRGPTWLRARGWILR
jgi:hypothetical protein